MIREGEMFETVLVSSRSCVYSWNEGANKDNTVYMAVTVSLIIHGWTLSESFGMNKSGYIGERNDKSKPDSPEL